MPFRQLPQSDAALTDALRAADRKRRGLVAPAKPPFPAETDARLTGFLPDWEKEIGERGAAAGVQNLSVTAANAKLDRVRMVASHFVQAFNMAVDRGEPGFTVDGRAYYGLELTAERVPDMTAETDALRWAKDLVDGEAKRVAAGGAPMPFPTAASLEAARAEAEGAVSVRQRDAEALVGEQGDVAGLRAEALGLVRDLWDETEHSFRKQPGPTRRRLARQWGVVYVPRPGEPVETDDGAGEGTTTATTAATTAGGGGGPAALGAGG